MNTATELSMRMHPNRRRAQINCMVAVIMDAIGKHIPDDGSSRRHACEDLVDALYKTGASFFTEQDRAEAGLSPRDDYGWTREELQMMDNRLTIAMLGPMPPMILPREKP